MTTSALCAVANSFRQNNFKLVFRLHASYVIISLAEVTVNDDDLSPAALSFQEVLQVDVPKGRDGKHKTIITRLLKDLAALSKGSALRRFRCATTGQQGKYPGRAQPGRAAARSSTSRRPATRITSMSGRKTTPTSRPSQSPSTQDAHCLNPRPSTRPGKIGRVRSSFPR